MSSAVGIVPGAVCCFRLEAQLVSRNSDLDRLVDDTSLSLASFYFCSVGGVRIKGGCLGLDVEGGKHCQHPPLAPAASVCRLPGCNCVRNSWRIRRLLGRARWRMRNSRRIHHLLGQPNLTCREARWRRRTGLSTLVRLFFPSIVHVSFLGQRLLCVV